MMKRLLLIAVFLAVSSEVFAAISVGNTSNTTGISQEAVTSQTWSHTVAATSNELVVVCGITDDTDVDATDDIGIDSITYNTTETLTKRAQQSSVSGGTDPEIHIWTRDAPSTGAHNIVVSYKSGNTMKVASCHAIDFGGVDQTTSQDVAAVTAADVGGGTVAQSITTATNGAMIVSAVTCKTVGTAVVDGTQTQIYETEVDGATNDIEVSSSYELKAAAGADTQSFTGFGADDATIASIALRPAPEFEPSVVII